MVNDTPTTDHTDDTLLPDGYFTLRNTNGAAAGTLTTLGSVLTKKLAVPLFTSTTSEQDNYVAMVRPVDVMLNNTGLSPADNSFRATTNTRSLQDQILLFDPTLASLNKPPSKTYYYISIGTNVGWRLVNDSTTNDHGADVIPAGSAIKIRKAIGNGQPDYWTNSPTY